METLLDQECSSDDIKIFEHKYNEELCQGKVVSSSTQFEYACFLVQSRYPADIQRGVLLLEELYKRKNELGKRDYVFYLAIGNTRQKEYKTALKYIDGLLRVEPANRQALDLRSAIKKKMENDALKGAAVVGGGVLLGVGAIIGLGIALASKK